MSGIGAVRPSRLLSVLAHHEEMASMIPHSHLVIIENCGHMSTMERPAEVTAALREWLTSL